MDEIINKITYYDIFKNTKVIFININNIADLKNRCKLLLDNALHNGIWLSNFKNHTFVFLPKNYVRKNVYQKQIYLKNKVRNKIRPIFEDNFAFSGGSKNIFINEVDNGNTINYNIKLPSYEHNIAISFIVGPLAIIILMFLLIIIVYKRRRRLHLE